MFGEGFGGGFGGSVVAEVMSYTTLDAITAAIPGPDLVNALDDDGDGAADPSALEQILEKAARAVDGYLAPTYDVPFSDVPAAVAEAAFVFACELVYDRRERTENNPFRKRAEEWRVKLGEIGAGELPLDAGTVKSFTPGAAVTESSSLDSPMG